MRELYLAREEDGVGNEMDLVQDMGLPFDEPPGWLHQF